MAGMVTVDTVRLLLMEQDTLIELIQLRDQAKAQLAQLCFDVQLQHARASAYLSHPFLTLAFLQWADRNVTNQNPEVREMARRIRAMVERCNESPLFEDGTTPTLGSSQQGDNAP